ncbi:MAG: PxKF domain-containing protein [Caldilineaceae bacterium]
MQRFCKRNFSRHAATWLLTLLLALGATLPAKAALDNTAFAPPAAAGTDAANPTHAFAFDQIGAEVDKQSGQTSTVIATASGATVRAPFQALVGALTSTGLWLRSTAAAKQAATSPTLTDLPFRVQASAIGRGQGTARRLAPTGTVTVANGLARWSRPGVVEEYSASTDGVRQDFLLRERPSGQGALRLELTVAGATLHSAADGVRLQLNATGRTLAYHRLQVSDAQGQRLPAHMQVLTPTRLTIVVDEAGAAAPVTWPLRIDPTFSDANWLPLGTGVAGNVLALAVSGSDLYVGGGFTTAGGVSAIAIAKWDGSSWSALGSGMNNVVRALAVSGSDLYVGGNFTTAGGVSANHIAKWDGSSWSALGDGLESTVGALAVSGSDLYVGGIFTTAGGVSANRIAKWDGSSWSALGTGLNVGSSVNALAVSGSDLYAGGSFTTADGVSANFIAKWDGSSWSALGTGLNGQVTALAVSGRDLYVAGFFTTAGGGSANRIAKWDGSSWSAFGSGLNSAVLALALSGSDFYVGGAFSTAGGKPALRIAKAQALIAQLAVTGQGVNIPSGATTPSSSNATDFGSVNLGSPVAHTFTLNNNGSVDLTVSAISTSGGNASDFVSSGLPLPATIAAGSSATFNVTFTPSAVGLRTTTLTIASNDPNKPSYTFALQGTGLFAFNGFFQPVDNLPALNTVKAGQGIPVKFSLGGNQGLNILAAGSPASQQIACDNAAPLAPIEETTTANSGLTYDASSGQYNYVWKTEKSWAGTCRQFVLRLTDGANHLANFKFK